MSYRAPEGGERPSASSTTLRTERNASSWGWVLSTPASLPALARFDVMSVANNHIMDAGYQGLSDTLAGLRANGVAPVGAT